MQRLLPLHRLCKRTVQVGGAEGGQLYWAGWLQKVPVPVEGKKRTLLLQPDEMRLILFILEGNLNRMLTQNKQEFRTLCTEQVFGKFKTGIVLKYLFFSYPYLESHWNPAVFKMSLLCKALSYTHTTAPLSQRA